MAKPHKEAEAEVKSWGFKHAFTWTDRPNAYYAPHKHDAITTHVVLNGSITYSYPNDSKPVKYTIGAGDRWDVDANRLHEVWVGKDGCTYVIGE